MARSSSFRGGNGVFAYRIGRLGEALGEAYVNKTFSPQAKADARQVIDDIRTSFRDRLLKLTWMSDSTRTFALAKLASMAEKVGYPDNWRDYSKLEVANGAFALTCSALTPSNGSESRTVPGSRWTRRSGA